jgi:uncharacterized protein YacL
MVLHILRALFVLLTAGVGWVYVQHRDQPFGDQNWLIMAISLAIAVLLVCVDILSPRQKLLVFSGTFLGLLVGLAIGYALSFVVQMIFDQYVRVDPRLAPIQQRFVNVLIGIGCCYLAISFILQTKDDFRFIIPYVEFTRKTAGTRPMLVDTSVIIDGRILDIAATGILESRLVVPRFVLQELQTLADSSDRLKRNRGRRGLDVLNRLQNSGKGQVVIYESGPREPVTGVDQKLLALAKELEARILSNDFNLCKVAQLQAVEVININDLANALKPVALPGEKLRVKILRPGEEGSQGVGYLDDGTMVVVEQGRSYIDEEVEATVTSVLQTSAGRMIFGRLGDAPPRKTPAPRQTA